VEAWGGAIAAARPIVVAALAARFRDLDLAEDAFAEAVLSALRTWREAPRDPSAWLWRAAFRKGLDARRRAGVRAAYRPDEMEPAISAEEGLIMQSDEPIPDERLRLIFVCCHPALAADSRAALTLKTVCGLSTERLARAFFMAEPAMLQRITRAKQKIRAAGVPFAVPGREAWPERIGAVLTTLEVAYLQAYEDAAGATEGAPFAAEVLQLSGLMADLLPGEPEVLALAAMVRFAEARRPARMDDGGAMIPLSEQDVALWDRGLIAQGARLLDRAADQGRSGPYQITAAIHGAHLSRLQTGATPWRDIAALYGMLAILRPDPVVAVNRAVAVAEVEGAEAGLALLDAVRHERLEHWLPWQAARAGLCELAGKAEEARVALEAALALTPAPAERLFLQRRLARRRLERGPQAFDNRGMDGSANSVPAPRPVSFRDPRYAARQLEVERRADGSILLFNPMPFDTSATTTLQPLARWSVEAPQRVWLAERSGDGWRTATYGEAAQQVAALAGGLAALGLGPDRPLLILSRNGIDHALVSYGAMSLGCPIAPIAPQYGLAGADLSRLAHACGVIQPGAVLVDDAVAFEGALASDILAGLPVIASRNGRAGDLSVEALLLSAPVATTARPDDVAKLLLTSGSTGLPKAVLMLHRNVAANSAQLEACYVDPDPPIQVNSAPWSHSLGANAVLHMTLHRGGTLYIDAGQPTAARFGETLRNLREVAPTLHHMVPAGWVLLASELERDASLAARFFSQVRILQYGGAAMPQGIVDRVEAVALRTVGQKISFGTAFGATETGPTACNIHWTNDRAGTCGLPVPGGWIKLAPEGEKYELRVKGAQVSPGYLRRPDATAAAFDEEGFYRLGDAAKLADPKDPSAGLIYDGRLVENFKLASGAFVSAGALRVTAVSAIGGAAHDAVVCGEGQEGRWAAAVPGRGPGGVARRFGSGPRSRQGRAFDDERPGPQRRWARGPGDPA
jgi:feruloyl-CoA synthase